MKIIKTKDWYDPEGLNIPNNNIEVIWEGPYEECLERLKNIRSSKITQFEDRKDITVSNIRLKRKVIESIPTGFGGVRQKSIELPQSEYFEIYFMSAIAKEYYSIVK